MEALANGRLAERIDESRRADVGYRSWLAKRTLFGGQKLWSVMGTRETWWIRVPYDEGTRETGGIGGLCDMATG